MLGKEPLYAHTALGDAVTPKRPPHSHGYAPVEFQAQLKTKNPFFFPAGRTYTIGVLPLETKIESRPQQIGYEEQPTLPFPYLLQT